MVEFLLYDAENSLKKDSHIIMSDKTSLFYITALAMSLWQLIYANKFFKFMAEHLPDYYESIGRPAYSYTSLSRRLSAGRFFSKVITGRLKDAPDDQRFRQLIRTYRLVLWSLVALLVVATTIMVNSFNR